MMVIDHRIRYLGIQSDKKPTKCKCPKCRKVYEGFGYYTGKGITYKFCDECRPKVELYSHTENPAKLTLK